MMEAEPFDAGPFVTCPACKHEHRERETCGTGGSSDDVVLPRADFDAREARLARAEHERDEASAMLVRHDKDGDFWHAEYAAATARADALAALLKEAADLMFDRDLFPVCSGPAPLRWRERIDAELEKKK